MRFVSLACVLLFGFSVSAQDAPRVIASVEGQFAGGNSLSLEADADRVAGLEQQAFREFRWDVVTETAVNLMFQASAPGAAEATLMISAEGEVFVPLQGTALPGQVISVLVTQSVSETEEQITFPATNWTFDLSAPSGSAAEAGTFGAILLPIEIGDDLGCAQEGCGEDAANVLESSDVAGEPSSEAGPETAPAAAAPNGGEEVARELQTELARVGCYSIEIDGLWGPGSRRAMTAYNEATGSSLPVDAPSARSLVAVARTTDTVCTE